MGFEALLVISVMVAALLAVRSGMLSAATASMAGLCLVTIGGVLQPSEAVQGFANPVVVGLASLYVVAAGLKKSRILEALASDDWSSRWLRPLRRVLGADGFQRILAWLPGDASAESGSSEGERWIAAAAMGALVLGPSLGLLRLETASLLGATLLVGCGVLSAERARRAIDWNIVVLVGALIGYGRALVETGASRVLGSLVPTVDPAVGSPISVAVLLSLALVATALTRRKAAASIVPLVLSAGLFLVASPAV